MASPESAQNTSVLGKPTFCVITGASRGLGRSLAVELSGSLGEGSRLVLTARSLSGLEQTQALVNKTSVSVKVVSGDLEDSDSYHNLFQGIFSDITPGVFQHALLIHNASSLGDVTKRVVEHRDAVVLQKYYTTNVTSTITLTARFLQIFPSCDVTRTVVNITSSAGFTPIKTNSLYCSGKAARDMVFKVLAEESPEVRVLSFSPGAMDTEMFEYYRTHVGDPEVRTLLCRLAEDGKLLKPEFSAQKLVQILEENSYKSGAVLDALGRFEH
ncbi:PREDICTED: sepiapterin reductase-like [Branchiostoma belcheri]|uniref:Sepiapterin reductase n=1 Tax=Branchiostoma belcheri TaxID=7741 RepID=A0A6P4ZN29_BRABE|nr:PREDICTED: sepiapterin reductase-like [Branchiostoma belcheri]